MNVWHSLPPSRRWWIAYLGESDLHKDRSLISVSKDTTDHPLNRAHDPEHRRSLINRSPASD